MALFRLRNRTTQPIRTPVSSDEGDRLFTDFYHHLLTSSWPALLLQIVIAFVLMNFLFAFGYYLNGGIENAHPDRFSDYFFFSVETIATIGYGKMSPTTMFSEILMSFEAVCGLINFALITGLIFAKFSRPTARVRFSRMAVISKRDGIPSLMFRMANVRSSQIVDAQVHLAFSRDERTREGEYVRRFYDLDLTRYRNAIFAYSWTAVHQIQPGSPFYGVTSDEILKADANVTVSLTGFDEVFSQTVYARYTYKAQDIIWGARLADIIDETAEPGSRFDFAKFDQVEPADQPIWSQESA
ncbi:MAG TPA: ion channel [Candidatus Binataceae bacterium]|jgi:inward rectifier potassium channel